MAAERGIKHTRLDIECIVVDGNDGLGILRLRSTLVAISNGLVSQMLPQKEELQNKKIPKKLF